MKPPRPVPRRRLRPAGCLALLSLVAPAAFAASAPADPSLAGFLGAYCLDCHSSDLKKGQLDLEALNPRDPAAHPALWEKVLRKLDHRQMPPHGEARRPAPACLFHHLPPPSLYPMHRRPLSRFAIVDKN